MALNDVLNSRRFQIVFAIGVVYWLCLSLPAGPLAFWKTGFFIPGYFFLIIVAALMGWRFPAAPWQSGRDIGIGMTVTMLVVGIFTSNGFAMLPFMLLMMIVLTLPLIAGNWLGAFLRLNRPKSKNL
ncbi:MAG: hypothetical protein JWO78_1895 [Micavibrio sp.]|nr:hypothetical protein [Micavibrio sp.]